MVVYGDGLGHRWRRDAPLEVGQEVRKNRAIMRLPDMTAMIVEVGVDEGYISMIEPGQTAVTTVEGTPDRFYGSVGRISATEDWRRDVKEFLTEVGFGRY